MALPSPRFGFGTYGMSRSDMLRMIPAALDAGFRHFDTAQRQWTRQRHWHTAEDGFVWVIEGEVVLVTSRGEGVLRAGDSAGLAAGVAGGHHFQNRSD